jgi:hypothetical protein
MLEIQANLSGIWQRMSRTMTSDYDPGKADELLFTDTS